MEKLNGTNSTSFNFISIQPNGEGGTAKLAKTHTSVLVRPYFRI